MSDPRNLELDDLVYEYPEIDNVRFQSLISKKEEFRELSSSLVEPIPKRGEFFKHQLLVHRFLLIYDRLLIIHRTGTGKTCAIGGSSEMFRRSIVSAVADFITLYMQPKRTHIKRVYLLLKNKTLEEQFKRELVCKCSNEGDYLTPEIMDMDNLNRMKLAVNKKIKTFYSIMTPGKLSKEIQEGALNNDQLREKYSGCLFVLDEVHNINIDPTKKTDNTGKRKTYNTLHRLFHVIERSKIILSSATPMINGPEEIVPIMNLILPSDFQMPIVRPREGSFGPNSQILGEKGGNFSCDYSNTSLEELEPYFRGRVSYVRESDLPINIIYEGQYLNVSHNIGGKIYKSQQKIFARNMELSTPDNRLIGPDGEEFLGQDFYYNLLMDSDTANNEKSDVSHQNEQYAAAFIFPNGKFGTKGSSEYIGSQNKRFVAGPELIPWLSEYEYIKMLSIKYADIIAITMDEKNQMKSSFCYSPWTESSGGVQLALSFQGMGYEMFNQTQPIFGASNTSRKVEYCQTSSSEGTVRQERRADIPKKPRIALFIGGKNSNTNLNTNILDTFNSYENRHGEYIKVLIVSKIGKEGINTANVQNIHILTPEWNQASMYQAISRVLRATSHVDLIEERRQQLIESGGNPENASVDVRIYQHAALRYDGSSTIDVNMYERIEEKDIEIKKIERIAKQCAIDCKLHRKRNIRSTDTDGSPICDYDVCDYKCSDDILHPFGSNNQSIDPLNPSDQIDYDSYDVLYSGEIVDVFIDDIKKIFKEYFNMTLLDLYDRLFELYTTENIQNETVDMKRRKKFIDMALEKIITDKMMLYDRFGYISYLREDNGVIFIQRDFPLIDGNNSHTDYSISTYSQNLTAIDSITLDQYQTEESFSIQHNIIEKIRALIQGPQRNRDEIFKILQEATMETIISLVETSILNYSLNGTDRDLSDLLHQYYQYNIYNISEPINTLMDTRARMTKPAGAGRRVGKNQVPNVSVNILEEEDNRSVYFHTLDSRKNISGYSTTSKLFGVMGTIRIFIPGERSGKWRKADPSEQLVYTKIAQNVIENKRKEFEQDVNIPVYGIVLRTDGILRPINMDEFRRNQVQKSEINKKTRPRGKKCSNYSREEISVMINILADSSVPIRFNARNDGCRILGNILREKNYIWYI